MTAPSLHELQQRMKSLIRPAGTAATAALPPLNPQRGTPGRERMAVYADGYVARLRESLAEVYEAVHHVLGEAAFTALARGYADRYPSHDYNLSFAGRHVPEFLQTWTGTASLPFLPDLARLEWRVCQAFHAFDEPPADLQPLLALSPESWERVTLAFQPSTGLVISAWPVLDIWAARQTPRETINIELRDRPQAVLVTRQQGQVRCELVTPAQAAVLNGLLRGEPLGAACSALDAAQGCAAELTGWFGEWQQRGLIIRVASR